MATKESMDREDGVAVGAILGGVAVFGCGVIVANGELEDRPQLPLTQEDVAALTEEVMGLSTNCESNQMTAARDRRVALFGRHFIVPPSNVGGFHRGVDTSNWHCASTSHGDVLDNDSTGFIYRGTEWSARLEGDHLVFTTPRGHLGAVWRVEGDSLASGIAQTQPVEDGTEKK